MTFIVMTVIHIGSEFICLTQLIITSVYPLAYQILAVPSFIQLATLVQHKIISIVTIQKYVDTLSLRTIVKTLARHVIKWLGSLLVLVLVMTMVVYCWTVEKRMSTKQSTL